MTQFCIVSGGDAADRQSALDALVLAFKALGGESLTGTTVGDRALAASFGAGPPGLHDGLILVGTPLDRRGAASRIEILDALSDRPDQDRRLQEFDGYFAAASVPRDGGPVRVTTDRTGSVAMHHARWRGLDVVSTSALVLGRAMRAPLDPTSVREFLSTGTVFEDRTLFSGVSRIGAATLTTYSGLSAPLSRIWLDPTAAVTASANANVQTLADALVAALRVAGAAHRRLVLDLTGGYDSRAVLGAAMRAGVEFTTVVNGADDDPDVVAANRIAGVFGLSHRQLRPGVDFGNPTQDKLWRALALTDGEADALEYASVMEVHERLAENGDASVNGSSGELCRGYWWDLLGSAPPGGRGAFDPRRVAAARFAFDPFGETMLRQPGPGTLTEHFTGVVDRADVPFRDQTDGARIDNIYLAVRMRRWGGRLVSATGRIWPCVSPFMFRDSIQAAMSASAESRRGNRMAPRLIEYLDSRLAKLPLAAGYPALPLRWSNAWRFLPRLAELGGKVWRRALRRAFGIGAPMAGRGIGALARLMASAGGSAWFDPTSWRSRDLYRDAEFVRFIEAARSPDFGRARHFGRILTLELVVRALNGADRP